MVKKLLSGSALRVDETCPEFLETLDWILVDTPLRHHVDIGDFASGLPEWDGGPPHPGRGTVEYL